MYAQIWSGNKNFVKIVFNGASTAVKGTSQRLDDKYYVLL